MAGKARRSLAVNFLAVAAGLTVAVGGAAAAARAGGAGGNGYSYSPALSPDGRFVAFTSCASNLVPGDTNNAERFFDVFVRDRWRGRTERVSVGPGGAEGNGYSESPAIAALSADGRFVAFTSYAGDLVPGDANGLEDVFVRDRRAGRTRRVSVGRGGAEGNGASYFAGPLSAEGRLVAFASSASNLVAGDTNGQRDVFVRDRWRGRTERVSLGRGGAQGNWHSTSPALSADGRFVAFSSGAGNLVAGAASGVVDVFVRDRRRGTTERVSVALRAAPANDCNGDFD